MGKRKKTNRQHRHLRNKVKERAKRPIESEDQEQEIAHPNSRDVDNQPRDINLLQIAYQTILSKLPDKTWVGLFVLLVLLSIPTIIIPGGLEWLSINYQYQMLQEDKEPTLEITHSKLQPTIITNEDISNFIEVERSGDITLGIECLGKFTYSSGSIGSGVFDRVVYSMSVCMTDESTNLDSDIVQISMDSLHTKVKLINDVNHVCYKLQEDVDDFWLIANELVEFSIDGRLKGRTDQATPLNGVVVDQTFYRGNELCVTSLNSAAIASGNFPFTIFLGKNVSRAYFSYCYNHRRKCDLAIQAELDRLDRTYCVRAEYCDGNYQYSSVRDVIPISARVAIPSEYNDLNNLAWFSLYAIDPYSDHPDSLCSRNSEHLTCPNE